MQKFFSYFLIGLFSILLLSGTALAATVQVQVYEIEGNVSPIPGASVYAHNALAGKTDISGIIEFSHPEDESISVRVTKRGYEEWTGDIGPNTTVLLVEMLRLGLPLSVQVYDTDTLAPLPGALVSISGNGMSNTTRTGSNGTAVFMVDAESTYNLDIEVPNYRPYSSMVDINFEGKNVQYLLFRDDRFTLRVKDRFSGEPLEGAEVLVDGASRGLTDTKGILWLQLPREKVYLIDVKREGYQDFREQRIVEKDQAIVDVLLSKVPHSVFISVYNESESPVEGAEVLVDGVTSGFTSRYGRLQISNLSFGSSLLEVRHPGYAPSRKEFQVTAQGEDISVDLEYARATISVLTLEVGAKPVPGVNVLLDGQEAGETGASGNISLRVRLNMPYTVAAEKEGYNPASIQGIARSENDTAPLVIPMEKSTDWILIGILILAAGAIALGVVIWKQKWKQKSAGRRPGGRGGL